MNGCITATELDDILALFWDQIVCCAHGWYLRAGRGMPGLQKTAEIGATVPAVHLMHAVYDAKSAMPSPEVSVTIRECDPDWEVVIQYVTDIGDVRTIRLTTGAGFGHPQGVCLLETMMAEDMGKSFGADFWEKMGMLDIDVVQ